MKNALFQVLVWHIERAFADDKHKVHVLDQLVLMMTDNFFDESAHSVANNSIPYFFADGNSYSKLFYIFFTKPVHDELMVRERLPMTIYATEVSAVS